MRPSILYPLFYNISNLSGVGNRYCALLQNLLNGNKIIDLLWHLPSSIIDRRCHTPLKNAADNTIWTGTVSVIEHIPPKSKKQPYRIIVANDTEQLALVFFKTFGDALTKAFPVGKQKIISGKIEMYNQTWQMPHPDYVFDADKIAQMPQIEPIYPLAAGITNRMLYKLNQQALACVPDLPEWLDESIIKRENFPSFKQALTTVHHPQGIEDLSPLSPARRRLAYDELLSHQISLKIVRERMRKQKGRALKNSGALAQKLQTTLDFELTDAQKRAIATINADLKSDYRMFRLLQGDVGAGKTIVALITMLNAVEAGFQAALMAPTEILAQQHYENISALCNKIGVKTALLTGSTKPKDRKTILAELASANIQILIGTHALFTDDVIFNNLAYIVVDEQHRFGVKQRLNLADKGNLCDVLVMTATPIPRTLLLTSFGDMDYTKIDELPKGRKPVQTTVIPISKIHDVIAALQRKLTTGAQAYWVCPLVEESEKIDLSAATERFESLKKVFGDAVGLIHGKMKESEKNTVMNAFKSGKIKLLISTTVIEVGVNVPAATVMIVEHAERFGLAQLHQLRGRIKRGYESANCILMYGYPLSNIARERLNTLRATEDGFLIAEQDLKLRGGGEILGTRQSGFDNFKLADLSIHKDLLETASKDAALLLAADPNLKTTERGQNSRTLLYLFECDETIRTYNAG